MSEFPKWRFLGDFVELQRGTTYQGKLVGLSGPVLLGLGSIEPGGGFREGKYKTYGGECPENLMLYPGDMYVALKGATKDGSMIGSVSRVPPHISSGRLTQDTVGLKLRDQRDELANHLYWVLRTPQYRFYCAGCASGSAVVALSRDDFLSFQVPPITAASRTLVTLLEAIEEKIALNQKQNHTLEDIAQALFKRWFVEFEFPDDNGRPYKSRGGAMQSSELGEIPVGWDVGRIGDYAEHKKIGVNPAGQPDTHFFHFSIPNFDDGQIAKPELGSTILSNKFAVTPASILVSKLNPRFPRIWPVLSLPDELSVCSTEFEVLVPDKKTYGYVLSLMKSPHVASEMVLRASGTSGSHQRINPDDLLSIEVVRPPFDLVNRFDEVVLDGIEKAQANRDQMKILAGLRDTLLPKLMSGELRVRDAA